MNTKRQQGFSLIELLIVVAIIGIIAAIAIPNLLASKRAANEGSAQASLRTLTGGQATYATAHDGMYGTLPNLAGEGIVDNVLGSATGLKSGYVFLATPIPAAGTACTAAIPCNYIHGAAPAAFSGVTATGKRKFSSDGTGVIYSITAADSTPASTTVAGTAIGN